MATAYLLASVLTLIVVLVHGQEAFPEQGNIVVVAEDSFEDELNSFTDLILPGSANTRAECIQKKKCKNKGGTCQNKGNTCPGKFVKGCSKGCSCCLPEEISCKPSKRCKRANGACIARGECNGKIISTGCKKPRSCKKTHVCCVQDETTTEVPTCRGPSCPLPDTCPNDNFVTKHVCKDCKRKEPGLKDRVLQFIKVKDRSIVPYTVFAGEDFKGNPIDFKKSSNGEMCLFKESVQTWDCTFKKGTWKCPIKGFCNGKSSVENGDYSPDSQICDGCPNPIFSEDHVDSLIVADACQFTISTGRDIALKINTVFDKSTIKYKETDYYDGQGLNQWVVSCLIENPVVTMVCRVEDEKWQKSSFLGYCTTQTRLANGHFYDKSVECLYEVHNGKIWSDGQCDPMGAPINVDKLEECKKKCIWLDGCHAFNYNIEDKMCDMRKCDLPVIAPDTKKEGYAGYYLYTGPTTATNSAKPELFV